MEAEKEKDNKIKELKENEGKIDLPKVYETINQTIRKYCDLREDYYNIVTLWVIGTWFHKDFPSFPYLFFNAMKGSGKSRLLKLLASMSRNGEVLANISEAVLFRTAEFSSIFIDEFEGVSKKGNNTLRELLNAGYKRGTKVKRAYKIKAGDREGQAIETFNVYCPIALCNIFGMESVLGDRCITLILEKSNKSYITKLIENFESDPPIQWIVRTLSIQKRQNLCSCVDVDVENNVYNDWNTYQINKGNNYTTTYTTITTQTTQTTQNVEEIEKIGGVDEFKLPQKEYDFFNKIDATDIDSRHLELFLPLFILAINVSPTILDETIETAKKIVEERKGEDLIENRDVAFLDFLANYDISLDFIPVTDLVTQFKSYIHEEDEEGHTWVSNRWVGWALRRLNLLIDKKRSSQGMEVMINFGKAKEKVNILRPKEKKC